MPVTYERRFTRCGALGNRAAAVVCLFCLLRQANFLLQAALGAVPPPPPSPPHLDGLAMHGHACRVAPETAASAGALPPKKLGASFSSSTSNLSLRESGNDISPKKIIARGTTTRIQASDRKRFHPRVVRRVHALMLAKSDVRVRMLLCFPRVQTCCTPCLPPELGCV